MGKASRSTEWSFKGHPAQSFVYETTEDDGLPSLIFVEGTLVSIDAEAHILPLGGGDVFIPGSQGG